MVEQDLTTGLTWFKIRFQIAEQKNFREEADLVVHVDGSEDKLRNQVYRLMTDE